MFMLFWTTAVSTADKFQSDRTTMNPYLTLPYQMSCKFVGQGNFACIIFHWGGGKQLWLIADISKLHHNPLSYTLVSSLDLHKQLLINTTPSAWANIPKTDIFSFMVQ